ncbi:hypothetical protein TNCV_3385781 [Trichonephila clavipes]|uniref:Uncharacterized protein n=1 Tax=Trichonephila clavipes TaxID=2585209 RepID=A0A8X6SZ27_TRICX|nr:hypothetical protein TNCV_3385781 [Trichonephila clavipes]
MKSKVVLFMDAFILEQSTVVWFLIEAGSYEDHSDNCHPMIRTNIAKKLETCGTQTDFETPRVRLFRCASCSVMNTFGKDETEIKL